MVNERGRLSILSYDTSTETGGSLLGRRVGWKDLIFLSADVCK